MDRRGLLRFMGVSAASAIVAPKLLLPAVRQIAVPDPQRRFFLPPMGGWPGESVSDEDSEDLDALTEWMRPDKPVWGSSAHDYVLAFDNVETRVSMEWMRPDVFPGVQPGDIVSLALPEGGAERFIVHTIEWQTVGPWRMRMEGYGVPELDDDTTPARDVVPDRFSMTRSLNPRRMPLHRLS